MKALTSPSPFTAPAGTLMNYAQAELYRTIAALQQVRGLLTLLHQVEAEGITTITLQSAAGTAVTVPMPAEFEFKGNLMTDILEEASQHVQKLEEQEASSCREVALLRQHDQEDRALGHAAREARRTVAAAAPTVPFVPRRRPAATGGRQQSEADQVSGA